ncbi:DUF6111 family protein [Blastochloris viridis]|uniref:Uncharacterized protein n=1 Tax=Blastochloris viridis TaxID=1079 RepID=A0A0H5BHA8_BLAVI|nr:DUF6111 family protein [Blastochloris viridis]ALK10258.1 hypothetical protein BVIR_2492 [Blastochloris viridis]BAR99811.1 hypothetical protein BV133_2218 [Blastochloris viridis]CUU42920.1 hypothetical protein BVIRIDIS_19360 [Blastochloris viridis]
MLRTFLIQAAVFLAPFAAYALYLAVRRRPVRSAESWTAPVLIWCGGLALILTAASLLYFTHFSRAPAGSTYVPPRVENGRVMPGYFK